MKNEIGKNERSKCSTHQDMQVRPGHRAVVSRCPTLLIDRFAEAAIECDVRMSLPFEAEIRPTAQTVTGRNRERIEHIVLVEVNTIVPVSSIKSLKANP